MIDLRDVSILSDITIATNEVFNAETYSEIDELLSTSAFLAEIDTLNLRNTYFDYARCGDLSAFDLANENIQLIHPDYSIESLVINSATLIRPDDNTSVILLLQSGNVNVSYFRDSEVIRSTELIDGDLLMLSAEDSAEISPINNTATFFKLIVKLPDAIIPEKRGITLLSELPNISGGCNPGGSESNPAKDFRRVVHVAKEMHPSGKYPLLDIYAVLIHADRSRPHYHPSESIGGPEKQHEIYIFLDPQKRDLQIENNGKLTTWKPGAQKNESDSKMICPGDIASIPSGVGHHANGLAIIFAFPGTLGLPNAVGIGK